VVVAAMAAQALRVAGELASGTVPYLAAQAEPVSGLWGLTADGKEPARPASRVPLDVDGLLDVGSWRCSLCHSLSACADRELSI
jgi:hypothetical protein